MSELLLSHLPKFIEFYLCSMHSNVTIKIVSWPHFSWPTLYPIQLVSVRTGRGLTTSDNTSKAIQLSSSKTRQFSNWTGVTSDPTVTVLVLYLCVCVRLTSTWRHCHDDDDDVDRWWRWVWRTLSAAEHSKWQSPDRHTPHYTHTHTRTDNHQRFMVTCPGVHLSGYPILLYCIV